MANITYELITDGNIEICRDLCNALMAFQKEQATIGKEAFDMMNFDTRMKVSYAGALRAHVVVAKDGDKAVGYIFSTIDETPEEARGYFPPWAPKGEGFIGFYPEWLELPQNTGCLSNLYVLPEYKGMGIGKKLTEMAVEWLESFDDVDISFVYISNGNDNAEEFYKKFGFTYCHDVYGGFIRAAYKKKA
jgi:Acetyltransferases